MPTASRRTRTPLTALLLVSAVLALLLGGAGPASAHAVLTNANPADAAVVKTAPTQVTLTFTESVSLSDGSVRVLSPQNQRVNKPADHLGGKANTVRAQLRGKLSIGTYTVAWRVVSADSHPISGAFTFSIGKPSATSAVAPSESPDDTAVSRLYGFLRYVAYGGLALLVGIAVFVLVCWPAGAALRPVRRLLAAGWAALLGSTLASLLLRGPYETGAGLAAAFDPSLLSSTLTGRSGIALGARLLLLAAAGVLLKLTADRFGRAPEATGGGRGGVVPHIGIRGRIFGVLLAVALAVTWAAAEHASAGLQVPLAIPVAVLHLLAMAVWLGGLVALVAVMFRAPADALIPPGAVARFSRLAFASVVVLVVTGVYQSWRQVGSWENVSSTEYGKLLSVKVAVVVLLLVAAALSRDWTARLLQQRPTREAFSAAAPEPVRVAQTVGAGASSDMDGPSDAGSAGAPSPPASADSTASPGSEPDRYRRGLRRSVAAEALLGAVVLAVTTLLTGTQPSRAAVETATAAAASQLPPAAVVTIPFDLGTPSNKGKVQITLTPGQVGENTVQALVFASDNGVSTVPELRLTFTQRAQKIGPLDAKLANRGGYWWTDSLQLPIAGTWTMQLTVRTSDVDQVTVSDTVTIRELPTRSTAP
ncbi:copper resistance protein CopC [Streptomyces iakyrus]|uniref:copper resistance CopC/CopD family protein n=1 Tax=Streptomyces iakyrus TaxID=68219 RepID=UPI0033BC3099